MIPSTLEEARPLVQDFPGLDDYGTYNKAPEPMRQITAEDYSARLLHWQVIAMESRQPKVLGYSSLCIHWLNTGNGVGMSRVWHWRLSPTVGPTDGDWTVEYWLIGCPHDHPIAPELRRLPPDPLMFAYQCADCGREFTYDSSG